MKKASNLGGEISSNLSQCVYQELEKYLRCLEQEKVSSIYAMVLQEVEVSIFKTVMNHVNGNQSKAADYLGIARGTLRKKLKQYKIIE